MTPMRRRPEGCLSEFAVERRRARELDAEEAAAADAHLATCARCRDLDAELTRARADFAANGPPLAITRARPRRVSRAWLASAAATFAAAAAVLLYVAARPNETRTKGSGAPALGFYVNHGGAIRRGGLGEHVAPGDGLRFVTTTREEQWLAVLSVDGAGQVSVYWPSTPEMARVEVGGDVGLPSSTVLDEVLGHETIYGVFCGRPLPIEPIRRAVELNPSRPPSVEGCTVEMVTFEKP